MRVIEIIKEEQKKGTYAGVRFSDKTNTTIEKFIKDNKIPNPIKKDKLHTTLLYSRKHLPKYEPAGELEEAMVGKPMGFEKWPSQPDDDAQTVDADDAVEVDDQSLPPQLSHLTELQLGLLREHAADNECSLLEAYEYSQRVQRNHEKKLEWRRQNEGKYNQPTTAYRPKPLY